MAGHSKWSNIKHRKARQDAKRGKIFTKLIRELVVAAKAGGPEPDDNPRLRAAVDKALRENMRRDTIDKAIDRGAGTQEGDDYEEIRYEGYAPAGVAVMVDCLTDNRNRTVGEVRHAFSKNGGNLGTDGSVAYMFVKQGVISFEPGFDVERLVDVAIESGAEDVVLNDDGSVDVITAADEFHAVNDVLIAAGFNATEADFHMESDIKVELEFEDAKKVMDLIDMIEDLDDVQRVYSNIELSEDVMAQLMEAD